LAVFLEKVEAARAEKRSLLCVGLDPAIPGQRGRDVIGVKYLSGADENEARLRFCLDIVEATKSAACAFKPNQHYLIGWTKRDHMRLTRAIREAGSVSILDCKLGDIGETLESALFHIRECGYDALTFNPLLGNLEAVVKHAEKQPRLGILVLTLTSNPEATRYQKGAIVDGQPLFIAVAKDVRRYGADGCVIGATSHISESDVRAVREIIGRDRLILIPGLGAQRGSLRILAAAGDNILVNVSRDIIYSGDPGGMAENYRALIFEAIRGAS
jgi:orotidine 5'-phosphate decarboxylase subfamily 2